MDIFSSVNIFFILEQLVGITVSIHTVKLYIASATTECLVVLRHSRNTTEKCSLLKAVSNTCESSAGYKSLKSVLLLDVTVTSIILLVCFICNETDGVEIISFSLYK